MPVASLGLRLPDNIPGDFFVDSTCIDCDACRIFAPTVFSDTGDQSSVFHQPESDDELLAAQKALISCPTASIGMLIRKDMRPALSSLPELIDGDVYRWKEQIRSMERLLDYRFEWVLPGHGRPIHLDAAAMHASLERCVAWMNER